MNKLGKISKKQLNNLSVSSVNLKDRPKSNY